MTTMNNSKAIINNGQSPPYFAFAQGQDSFVTGHVRGVRHVLLLRITHDKQLALGELARGGSCKVSYLQRVGAASAYVW